MPGTCFVHAALLVFYDFVSGLTEWYSEKLCHYVHDCVGCICVYI
jgi:hypothetical protein